MLEALAAPVVARMLAQGRPVLHPLVLQLRVTRGEFQRGAGIIRAKTWNDAAANRLLVQGLRVRWDLTGEKG